MTMEGIEVAVKVQYPELRNNIASDLSVFRTMGSQMRPGGLDLTWLIDDFESFLSAEIDFQGEARNAATAATLLAHRGNVLVPKAVAELTTARVIVSRFVPGLIKVNDPAAIEAAGMSPAEVAALVSDVFAEMILCMGTVHGDPHSGNVYVRKGVRTALPPWRLALPPAGLDRGPFHLASTGLCAC